MKEDILNVTGSALLAGMLLMPITWPGTGRAAEMPLPGVSASAPAIAAMAATLGQRSARQATS